MLSKSSFFSELKKRLTILSLLFAVILPSTAYADVFGFWIKPKMDFVSGTGEVFKRFEGQPAGGLEVGLELLGLSFWGDAEFMSALKSSLIDNDLLLVDAPNLTAEKPENKIKALII